MIPKKLYHATYIRFLKSIQQNGLGNTTQTMYEDSVPGVVYLANEPEVAESYAECSDWYEEQDEDAEGLDIVIIEVDTDKLDKDKMFIDKNVLLDEDEENSTWEYHGIIPWEACKVFDYETYMAEEFKSKHKCMPIFLNEDFINVYEELSILNEAKTGIPYKGYIICYGCHNTDRWYIKDSYENFLGTKSGYSTEKEAQEEIDEMVEDKNLPETISSVNDKCLDLCENTRSSAEIQAEIDKLQQELIQAKIAERKAAYAGNLPEVVYIWDMYMNVDEKGTWTSAELRNNKYEGTVFETEKAARDAALNLLSELDDEDELDSDDWNDDYDIDAVEIPLSEVSEKTLRFSNLDHLIS